MAQAEKVVLHLWLDESGMFLSEQEEAADKSIGKQRVSLVGGVYCLEKQIPEIRPKEIIEMVRNCPDFQPVFQAYREMEKRSVNVWHSTELPDDVKVPARFLVIQECARRGMHFVFFRPPKKFSIVDSSTTYLNYLAEGLTQFLNDLSINGRVVLNVTIGRRKDTAKASAILMSGQDISTESALKEAGDIEKERYETLLKERIALARIRHLQCTDTSVEYHVSYDYDKSNDFLVLSDYVCSCRYGLDTSMSYQAKAPDGKTYREKISEILDGNKREYGLWDDLIKIEARHNLHRSNWGGALFQLLAEMKEIPGDMRQLMTENFHRLHPGEQRTQMRVFFQLADTLSQQPLAYEGTETLMTAFLAELEKLPVSTESLLRYCRANALLYRSAVRNHLGKIREAYQDLVGCEGDLAGLLRRSEDRDLFFIQKNRLAILLQDFFDYQGAERVLNVAREAAEIEHAYNRDLCELLDLGEPIGLSDQHAKVLGSLALNCLYWMQSNPVAAEDGEQYARKAAEAFQEADGGRRHLMNLAVIEAQTGERKAAIASFARALNCTPKEIPDTLKAMRPENVYVWYSTVRFADGLWDGPDEENALARALYKCLAAYVSQYHFEDYPAHSFCRRLGTLALRKADDPQLARKLFSRCEALCFERNTTPDSSFWGIGMAAIADQMVYYLEQLENGEKNRQGALESGEKKFCRYYAQAMEPAVLPQMRAFYSSAGAPPAEGASLQDKLAYYRAFSDRVGH